MCGGERPIASAVQLIVQSKLSSQRAPSLVHTALDNMVNDHRSPILMTVLFGVTALVTILVMRYKITAQMDKFRMERFAICSLILLQALFGTVHYGWWKDVKATVVLKYISHLLLLSTCVYFGIIALYMLKIRDFMRRFGFPVLFLVFILETTYLVIGLTRKVVCSFMNCTLMCSA